MIPEFRRILNSDLLGGAFIQFGYSGERNAADGLLPFGLHGGKYIERFIEFLRIILTRDVAK